MAQLSFLTFRIAKLWGSPQGTIEKHLLEGKISYPDENLDFASNFRADVQFIKLKESIVVIMEAASVDMNVVCQTCLKKFKSKLEIPSAEREFLFDEPSVVEDPSDLYLINKKMMTVDLGEMIRQEIILHLPLVTVCSRRCKGLCHMCGKNKNTETCSCEIEEKESTHQPFKNLKSLLKAERKTPKKERGAVKHVTP